jgi:hypothetical protein
MNNTNNESLKKYDEKMNDYVKRLTNYHVLLEVCKCCDYGQIVPVYKKGTLREMYKSVCYNYDSQLDSLYTMNAETGEKLVIPHEDITVKDYMQAFPQYFKPLYPVPAMVVYKIYLDKETCDCGPLII